MLDLDRSRSRRSRYSITRDGDGFHCSCFDFELRRSTCKHGYAVEFFRKGRPLPTPTEKPPLPRRAWCASPTRRTGPRTTGRRQRSGSCSVIFSATSAPPYRNRSAAWIDRPFRSTRRCSPRASSLLRSERASLHERPSRSESGRLCVARVALQLRSESDRGRDRYAGPSSTD